MGSPSYAATIAAAINLPGLRVVPRSLGDQCQFTLCRTAEGESFPAAASEQSPAAIGRAVAFFASERVCSISGQTLNLGGVLVMS